MKILLDTHILIWAMLDRPNLSSKARELILQNRYALYYSMVSIWEIAIKHRLHPESIGSSGTSVMKLCQEAKIKSLSLTNQHIAAFEHLQRHESAPPHKDPFDQMLIAQAAAEDIIFLTHDKTLQFYEGVNIELV